MKAIVVYFTLAILTFAIPRNGMFYIAISVIFNLIFANGFLYFFYIKEKKFKEVKHEHKFVSGDCRFDDFSAWNENDQMGDQFDIKETYFFKLL